MSPPFDSPSTLAQDTPCVPAADTVAAAAADTVSGEEDTPAAAAADTPSSLAEDVLPAAASEISLAPAKNTSEAQRGRPFDPGQSGNPSGRPKGSRNRVTKAVAALDGHSEALVAKAVEMALDGDSAMARALVNTLVPRTRDRTIEFDLPKIETAADACAASSALLAACSRGELSPNEANQIMALISTHVRTIEVAELETRLTALEKRPRP
jgi:hypothetical protein